MKILIVYKSNKKIFHTNKIILFQFEDDLFKIAIQSALIIRDYYHS